MTALAVINLSQWNSLLCLAVQTTLHLGTGEGISSGRDELSYSMEGCVLAEKGETVDVSVLCKKKTTFFNHDQGRKLSEHTASLYS